MMINFPELARQAAADGAISPEEVLALRRSAWPDGRIDETEAEAILAINEVVSVKSPEWIDFLVEAVGEYVLNGTEPRGYVADQTVDWLIAKLDHDGRLDSEAELELLVRILEKAFGTPDRLKDATLGADNAAEWQRLFVQGVGNYLQGWQGAKGLTRERAAELESFMNQTSGGLGSFLSRMSRVGAGDLRSAALDLLGSAPARNYAGEADVEAAITSPEQSWLDGKIAADGQTDPLEQALLAFLAEG